MILVFIMDRGASSGGEWVGGLNQPRSAAEPVRSAVYWNVYCRQVCKALRGSSTKVSGALPLGLPPGHNRSHPSQHQASFFFLRDSRSKSWQLGWSLCVALPMLCHPLLRRLTGSMRTRCASQQNGRTQESPSLPTNLLDGARYVWCIYIHWV